MLVRYILFGPQSTQTQRNTELSEHTHYSVTARLSADRKPLKDGHLHVADTFTWLQSFYRISASQGLLHAKQRLSTSSP